MARILIVYPAFMADHQALHDFLAAPRRRLDFMDFAERERRRLQAAQEAATAQAKAGQAAPGADMVAVFSIAGFEIADIFAEWQRRTAADATAQGDTVGPDSEGHIIDGNTAGGLGPPWILLQETPEAFGQRVARAVLTLIKEV
jgi:hypothetical protein